MFSILYILKSFLWRNKDNFESDNYNHEDRTGTITDVSDNYGCVDNKFYFVKSMYHEQLEVGQRINFLVFKRSEHHDWQIKKIYSVIDDSLNVKQPTEAAQIKGVLRQSVVCQIVGRNDILCSPDDVKFSLTLELAPCVDSKKVLTIDDMPPELHLKIFEYLTRNDLIAVQCVCCKWRTLAHDRSLWKDYTFVITGTPEDEKKLKVMPALRNIGGYAHISFSIVILDHVMNLTKMNCIFKPPLSFAYVQSLVQKYPDLQSVTLDICPPDTVQSVEILQTCKNLKEIILHKEIFSHNRYRYCSCFSLPKLISVLNIFADSRNFTTLNNLDLRGVLYYHIFKNKSFSNVFTRVLTCKSHQIQALSLYIDSNVDVDMINAVNMCSRIQHLQVNLATNTEASIDISRMVCLSSLKVAVNESNDSFIKALDNSFSRNSWVNLTKVYIRIFTECKYRADILGGLIKNAKQLRSLIYQDLFKFIDESQLEHIGNLSKLEMLSLSSFSCISEKGIINISHCHNLKHLDLRTNAYSASLICRMKHLNSFMFDVRGPISIQLRGKEDIKMFFFTTHE